MRYSTILELRKLAPHVAAAQETGAGTLEELADALSKTCPRKFGKKAGQPWTVSSLSRALGKARKLGLL